MGPDAPDFRLTRRRVIRGASAVAVAGVGSAALAACGVTGKRAQGTAQHAAITLVMQPNGTIPWSTTLVELYQNMLEPWLKQNKGVAVKLIPSLWYNNPTAILGGSGSDIISDNYPPPYLSASGNLLLPLDPLLKRDNISTSAWSAGQINSYLQASPDHGLYMLPGYFSPMVPVVRLSDWDSAGYERPNPNWTATEFLDACRKITDTAKNRIGAVLEWDTSTLALGTYMFNAFGPEGMITPQGQLNLNTTANVAAGNWLYQELFWQGYATTRDIMGPGYNSTFLTGDRTAMTICWDGLVLNDAQTYQGFLWDYYMPPAFPEGPTCFGTDDFYAIPNTTKHPEQAWSLLKFVTYDATASGWQRQLMKVAMLQPSLNQLWDAWIATVKSVAPPLANVNLTPFKTMALNGRAFPQAYFPVADQQAEDLTAGVLRQLWSRQLTVQNAWDLLDQQVNGLVGPLLQQQAAELQAAAKIAAVTPGKGHEYPAPSKSGQGDPSSSATQYVLNNAGTWTLLGDGAAMGTTDNAIFACVPVTSSVGSWTCQVTGLANVSETNGSAPVISDLVRVGIMARGDLTDTAPDVVLAVTGGKGLEFMGRPASGVTPISQTSIFPKVNNIYQTLTSSTAIPTPNFITHPIWLRLTRDGTTWTASYSLDGTTFASTGTTPLIIPAMGGAWVGIFCSAHNTDFSYEGYVRATFANISGFTPTTMVQVGALGVPPSAGTVPSNWSTINITAPATTSATGTGSSSSSNASTSTAG